MTTTPELLRRSIHRIVDRRLDLRLPRRLTEPMVGTVTEWTGGATALVRLGGSSVPVPVDVPAMPTLQAGDRVLVDRGTDGSLVLDKVLGRSGPRRARLDIREFGELEDGQDATALLQAAFEHGGAIFIPDGDFLIAGKGASAGGVVATLSRSLDVLCGPNARLYTDSLDHDMVRITAETAGVTFAWQGGTFDQRRQANGNSDSFVIGYPGVNPGSSAVASGLIIQCYASDDTTTIRHSSVSGTRFLAGTHWQSAGGDSALGCDGSIVVTGCEFDGYRDSAIYLNWNYTVPGRGDAQAVEHCVFRNLMSGIAVKRGAERFVISGNSFNNVYEPIMTQPITGYPAGGDSDERLNTAVISGNTGSKCVQAIRLDWTDQAIVTGNVFRDFGALLADGTTYVPITTRSSASAVGVLLRGCTDVTVIGNWFEFETSAAKAAEYTTSRMISMVTSSTAGAATDTSNCFILFNIGDSGWGTTVYDEDSLNTSVGNLPAGDIPQTTWGTSGQTTISSTNENPLRVDKWANATAGTTVSLRKSKGAAVGTHTAIGTSEAIGVVEFRASGGTSFIRGADIIVATQTGTISDTSMPSRFSVRTTPDGSATPVERVRIDSTGTVDIMDALVTSDVISPSSLGAAASTTSDWAPTGIASATVIRMTCTGACNLTGITTGASGRHLYLYNISANTITLKHDTTSIAGNRFYGANSADVAVRPNGGVHLLYDGTSSRWRITTP